MALWTHCTCNISISLKWSYPSVITKYYLTDPVFFSFINSSKKNKSKAKKLFDGDINSDSQQDMKELLGLCSGRFSDSEDSRAVKNTNLQNKAKERTKGTLFDTQGKQGNMNELLGLCSGKFTDDENEIEDDNLESGEKEGSDAEAGDEKDGSAKEEQEKKKQESEDDASDPEEMILKRKFGKKYETKKRYVTITPQ